MDAEPLPDVTGIFINQAGQFLHDAGYVVTITSQKDPVGGTPDMPPGPVSLVEGRYVAPPVLTPPGPIIVE